MNINKTIFFLFLFFVDYFNKYMDKYNIYIYLHYLTNLFYRFPFFFIFLIFSYD